MRIAFCTTRPDKASFRFRIARYYPVLDNLPDIEYETFIIPKKLFERRRLYAKLASFDVVLWQKRLLGAIDIKPLRRNARKLVYDIDDAVMFNNPEDGSSPHSSKKSKRFQRMMENADLVMVGNDYLGDLAAEHIDRARITRIPSAVDIKEWKPATEKSDETQVTVGWVGSRSTLPYWFNLLEVWQALEKRFAQVKFLVVCDQTQEIFSDWHELNNFEALEWSEEKQVEYCQRFDIGVMPLTDNVWAQGKCGFKLIQYSALGIPAVASPVGVNAEIILDSKTGLLADTVKQWTDQLSRLIENSGLCSEMGSAGREHIVNNYSIQAWQQVFVDSLTKQA